MVRVFIAITPFPGEVAAVYQRRAESGSEERKQAPVHFVSPVSQSKGTFMSSLQQRILKLLRQIHQNILDYGMAVDFGQSQAHDKSPPAMNTVEPGVSPERSETQKLASRC